MHAPPVAPEPVPALLEVVLRSVASALGVLGFALLVDSTVPMALGAAAIGMVADVLRLQLVDAGVAVQIATTGATLVAGLLAAWAAPRLGVRGCSPTGTGPSSDDGTPVTRGVRSTRRL